MDFDRLKSQIEFLAEIDRVKTVLRQTRLLDNSRYENDAEHSWHLAMFVLVLAEYAESAVLDVAKTVKMVLIHDLVEIDAGDTFLYDEEGKSDKAAREAVAAERIFGMLPEDQGQDFLALWREFEDRQTPEARFAASVDRLQPLLHNYRTQGHTWQKHDVKKDMVLKANGHIEHGSKALWEYAKTLIDDAVAQGYLDEAAPSRP